VVCGFLQPAACRFIDAAVGRFGDRQLTVVCGDGHQSRASSAPARASVPMRLIKVRFPRPKCIMWGSLMTQVSWAGQFSAAL
jgi:hypothetical protein